jgi:purine-binding chemotaxis protein CheW
MAQTQSAVAAAPASAGLAGPASDVHQHLTFALGGEMYAMRILNVKEIIEYGHLTEIPMMPPFIRGVINLRGAVVPVIDLASRFGNEPTCVGKRTCIVIAELAEEHGAQDVGVMVDAVSEVLDIPASEIEPAPTFGAQIRTDFIEGIGKINGRFVILLNVRNVLSIEEMATLSNLGAQSLAADTDAVGEV